MRFDLAGPKDEPGIQRLLHRTPLAGGIRLSLERQPSAFVANAVGSEQIQILVGRGPANGEVAAMGVRGVMDWYCNGVPGRIGYLGQLRVDPCYRARPRLLLQGYAKLRELHEADGATLIYATTISADNVAARRILEASIEGMPRYRHIDDLITFVIATHAGSRRCRGSVEIANADSGDLEEIERCLARYGTRRQFSPVWSRRVLSNGDRMRDLGVEDFVVARGNSGVVGCLALWDQRKFKQTVVRGYSRRLACARPAANVLSRLTGSPRLPPVGAQLAMAYVSHVAVGDGDPEILEALLRRALDRAAERNIELVALGFSRRNVLAQVVARGFWAREYHSRIYVAFWPDGAGAADAIEDLPCHLEVAIL